MKTKIAINRLDFWDLVAIWEFTGCQWKLLCIERLTGAIALYRQSPVQRLVFPTDINLDKSANIEKQLLDLVEKPLSTTALAEQLHQLITKSPGITTKTAATRLNVSCITARKYLRQLESEQKICCQLSAWDGKTYTYYPVKPATTTVSVPSPSYQKVMRVNSNT